jgi:hypothetical protein
MKQKFVLGFVLLLCISQTTFGQVVIPHAIPCVTITPENILTLPSGISANECITADGETVNFKPDQHYSIRAGEYIEFNENTVITPDGSHQFHAYIQKEELDVAWYYPNETPGTVGRYEKLEIGVQFDSTIQNKIERFVNREAGTKLNPFNPEDVDVYAEFWVKIEGYWFYHKRVNGFYYQEFSRNIDTLTWDTVATLHNFRVRYAPPQLGTFRCRITAEVFGHDTLVATDFTFDVVPSSNKGFMDVGENYKYFEFGEEPFFPVGHNLMGPQDAGRIADYIPSTVPAYGYVEYCKTLRHLKESGANYVRYIASPWQTEIEFEHLGDYSNRMTNAWEFDNILDTTKALGLKMHFNMAVHFNWDQPNGDGKIYWDWSASGDSLNTPITPWGLDGCFRDIDSGYCYRSELDMEDPRDFFTDVEAIKHYKNRIRYMEARWGYSTEIAVTEIISEASHLGTTCELVYTEGRGCAAAYGSDRRPYDSDLTYFPAVIKAWHKTMSDYMKDSLKTNHLISVSYAGEPDFSNGDDSYRLSNVDIMTYNNYQLAITNIETIAGKVAKYQMADPDGEHNIHKPFMNSEYGTGSRVYLCDNNASFIHRISTSPFTGLATLPMTWDSQFDEEGTWHYLQKITELMEGIPLDNENWKAGDPIIRAGSKLEIFYLRKGEVGPHSKMIGAISNRTYNYWTQSLGGDCDSIYSRPDTLYRSAQNLTHLDYMFEPIVIYDLGALKDYKFEWINALTGASVAYTEQTSNLTGKLNLLFPYTLSGDTTCPIMFFKMYMKDDTFLAPIAGDTFGITDFQFFQIDSTIKSIDKTNWVDKTVNTDKNVVTIQPNPTTSSIEVVIHTEQINQGTFILCDESGKILLSENITSPNLFLDLSVYTAGIYYLTIEIGKERSVHKIIKL